MRARYTLVDKIANADGTVDVYFGSGALSGAPFQKILAILRAHLDLPLRPSVPEAPAPVPMGQSGEMTFVLTSVPANQFADPPGTVYDLLTAPAGKPEGPPVSRG